MDNKQNLTPASHAMPSVSNRFPGGHKSTTLKETSLNKTVSGTNKSVNHVPSKGSNKDAGSESMGGATPSGNIAMRSGQKATESFSGNKNKNATGPSAPTSKGAVTKLQKPASTAAAKPPNTKPLTQTGASSNAKTGPPKAREFNVTHLSDNWKRRKAEKLAAIEREKAKLAAAVKSASNDETKTETITEATEIGNNKNGLDQHKESMMEADLPDIQEDLEPEPKATSALPKDLLFPMNGLKGDTTSKLEQLELLLKENRLDELAKTLKEDKENDAKHTNGFPEFGEDSEENGKPEPFDIDKSPSESDSEEPKVSPRSKNKTLMAYLNACAKSGLKPNPSFMRQCGRSSIDMRNRMLTHKDAKPIAIALVGDRRTSLLDLSDNPLGPQGTRSIAEMMYANESIMELNLSNTDVGTGGLEALAQTLPNNNNLRRLHLDNNKLQEGDGRHLAKIITTVPDLRELHLNQTTLGFKDGTRLALALASDTGNLNTLSLQYNNIRTESAVQLALSLGKNTTLRSLNLAWNGFGADGCRALAKALGENSTLTELDLTNNRLGITSLEHIVEGLKKNSSLKSVKFGTNPMTTEGAKALVTALGQTNDTSVEEIDLRGIPVDEEFMSMAECLHESRGIKVLHETTAQMGTSNQTKQFDGDNLDRFDPVMVLFEYMKKDNLRVIDLFQVFWKDPFNQ
ncbi:leucine-rich repeat-containing protein 74B-like [Elysia marginata]|uniref:Leucine-rich repeat-containing protein 74B-like n=1 Tax=Elysia marginata TaxID=1093978 RepID=A0AAV4IJF8_9GAST|nr:leucine-rich repeat-containing protein 74B-like [Elysia marginata]